MMKFFKVFIKDLFQTSYGDPAILLPTKVMDHLLSYLNGADLLNCSAVNKNWYNIIAKSPKCMDKIRIIILEPYNGMMKKFTEFDAAILVKSGRMYKHISMYTTRNMTKDHLFLVASFQWKSFKLHHHVFRSEIELINFLGLIEPSVTHLELRHLRIVRSKQQEIAVTNFIFPNLKILKALCCYNYIYSEILKNVDKLEVLEIETGPPHAYDDEKTVIERAKALQQILIRNEKVKKLKLFIHQKDFDNMFIDERFLSRLKFKLDELKVKNFRKLIENETNVVQINNFGRFLKTQKKSMKTLHLLEWIGNDILELVINAFDDLHTLLLDDLDCYGKFDDSIANMNLFKNESIENLTLSAKQSKCNEIQKCLLKMVPYLKVLNIGTVNQQVLEIIIDKTPKLERIKMDYFTAYIIPDLPVLECLKEMRFNMSYAENFRDMLRDFTEYSNFEAVFLKGTRSYDKRERQPKA